MTVIELKKKLINEINQSEDAEILEEMYRLIANELSDNTIYKLSEEQINAVEEARKQFRNQQYLTSEQADKNIDEWLEK